MFLRHYASLIALCSSLALAACAPSEERACVGSTTDLATDPLNCGSCGNVCSEGFSCIDSRCLVGMCQPGAVEECYTGAADTAGVGPCVMGERVCDETGTWSFCEGEITPVAENCADAVDNNCNGAVDEDTDADADGFTTCGGDCCDSTECSKPELVNPGAFDAGGNNFDDDCDGIQDNTLLLCDQSLDSNSTNAMDFAKAIDICQTASDTDKKWGVISAAMTLTDGTGVPDKEGYAIRPRFGANTLPQGGVSLAMISTGGAAAKGDVNPGYHHWESYTHAGTNSAPFPADWYAANGNSLPTAPGCTVTGTVANDPVMLTLRIRVPTNALSFKLLTNFFSAEFPEFICTSFNDFVVVLLDSTYAGTQPNPADKNLAFFQAMGSTDKVPVGVNLGHGDTGLFTQCMNGPTCGSSSGTITSCLGIEHLVGTGFDDPASECGGAAHTVGGATGWLTTAGNVTPGEIITLRIAIWDTGDNGWDSLAVIDGFQWSTEVANPGTVIE